MTEPPPATAAPASPATAAGGGNHPPPPPRHSRSIISLSSDDLPPSALSTRGQALPALISSSIVAAAAASRRSSTNGYGSDLDDGPERDERERRSHLAAALLMTPQMRSQRLIGNSNPRYQWEQYYKNEKELSRMSKPVREYYERNNFLIQQYIFIDRLLDSSLPHDLIQEYSASGAVNVPATITEESGSTSSSLVTPDLEQASLFKDYIDGQNGSPKSGSYGTTTPASKLKRTPRNLYKIPDEEDPLLQEEDNSPSASIVPPYVPEEEADSNDPIVTFAIYLNLVANTTLLILKIAVAVMTSSLSVIASLVDAALDFLSTAIVWTTTYLISRRDQYAYPVGRRRLEPIGVLVFSVIMVISFVQVGVEGIQRLTSNDQTVVQLTIPAIAIMASTVLIKFACWLWCRFIRNSSVQALAQDAMTDVVFNIFSIIFPLVGFYIKSPILDPLGGILLSLYVIITWSRTTTTHIRNLTGAAATADERNVLLYLTMRFAKTIRQIQGLQAYHAGDKLNVEVDLVLEETISLRDSHDLGESLQYVLESVPSVDRAFVHLDYASWNLPSHLNQDES